MPRGKKKEAEPKEPPPPNYISDPSEVIGYHGSLPISVGKNIEVDERPGVIVGFKGYNLVVVYDDDPAQSPYICHPTWRTVFKRKKATS